MDGEESTNPSLGTARIRREARESRFIADREGPGNFTTMVYLAEEVELLQASSSGGDRKDRGSRSKPPADVSWDALDPAVQRRERRKRMEQAWDTMVMDFRVRRVLSCC